MDEALQRRLDIEEIRDVRRRWAYGRDLCEWDLLRSVFHPDATVHVSWFKGPFPAFVERGTHFEKDQPLYIIEVMKMFNTVRATFSGTIDKIIMQGADGSIVQKGQPLFNITPDEKFVEVDPALILKEKRERTGEYLAKVL